MHRIAAALSRTLTFRAVEAAFLAAVVGACGPTVPRGDVGQGGVVRGLVEACMRLGAEADDGGEAARAWFDGFCAPFFGWPKVDAAPISTGGGV